MNILKYYVVELIKDVEKGEGYLRSRNYNKGERVMVWKQDSINTYWVANSDDCFFTDCAKEIFEFIGKEIV